MAEHAKTAAQTKAEGVLLLFQTRLVALQNLLRSLRQEHAERCYSMAQGHGDELIALRARMSKLEQEIISMSPLLAYAKERADEAEPAGSDAGEETGQIREEAEMVELAEVVA